MNTEVLSAIRSRGQVGDKGLKDTSRIKDSMHVRLRTSGNVSTKDRLKLFTNVQPRESDMAEWEMLVQRVRGRTVIPFVGAGLSCGLLPMWDRLIEQLLEKLGLPQMKGEKMPVKTEVIRDALRKKERERTDKKDGDLDAYGMLASEFVELFKKTMEGKGCSEWCDSLLQGARPPIWQCPQVVRNATLGHRAVTTGPWPLILTTNWDTMLEASYRMVELNLADVWDSSHPDSNYFTRFGPQLAVRFRKNMQQVYAELRAGIRPTRLLKLHGDFTEGGKNELVAGHADYRQLMVRDVAFSSLLFYGCSLADPDMLATLDGMIESLGSEVGPHFWLTADEVSDEKKQFLMKHYSVYTVRTKKAWEFSDVLALLINLCNIGWPIPKPLTFTALHYQIISQHGANINIQIEHRLPQEVAAEAIRSDSLFALAISAGVSRSAKPIPGGQITAVFEELKLLKHHEVKAFRYDTETDEWRAKLCADNCWFVCGHDVGSSGTLRGVFEAVQHFVKNTVVYLVPGSSLVDNRQTKEDTKPNEIEDQSESQAAESAVAMKTEVTSGNPAVDMSVKEESTEQPQTDTTEVVPAGSLDSGLGEMVSPSVESIVTDANVNSDNEGLVSRWFNAVYSLVIPEDSDSEFSDAEESHTDEDVSESRLNGSGNDKSRNEAVVDGGTDQAPVSEPIKTEEQTSEKTEKEAPSEVEKSTLLQLADDQSDEEDGGETSKSDDETEQGDGSSQSQKKIRLILPLLSAGGGFLHGQDVLCATLSAIGHCSPLVCGPDVVDIVVCIGTYPKADNERLALMADIDVGQFCLGQLLTRAIHGKMEFTCVAPKDDCDYSSTLSHVDEKVTKWTCRKLHMPIYATVNELRREMGLPDKQGEEGEKSLLSANITDGSVVEISE